MSLRTLGFTLFLALAFIANALDARAQVAATTPATLEPPPPPGLGWKRRLSDEDYARKNQGGYFTGLPFANYDPNTGFGVGGRVYYYFNGYRDNPLFAYTPYLQRLIVQSFASTGGAQDHIVDYDAPNFLGSLYRVRATLEYEAANAWPYYGIGSRSLQPLSFPGAPGKTFASAKSYDRATAAVQPDGTTYGLYNLFGVKHPALQLGVERLLLGGVLRPFVGLAFSYIDVRDRSGVVTNAVEADGYAVRAPQATTMLGADCAAGRIVGCNGGFDNVLRLGISVDTRDFEPDPNSGIYAEISTETATKALGSQFDYVRAMGSVRAFFSPFPKIADLVVAARGLYLVQSAGTPFFTEEVLPFIDDNHAGLGGFRTMRGFRQNRFVGPIVALTNYEVRWTFAHFRAFRQGFALIAAPFLDMGRVFDSVRQTTLAGWKRSQGGGLRIAWNEATIIAADFGFSDEDSGLYINFNHIF